MQTSPKSEVKMTENVLPLPKSKLPECWTDDMRMNYLYSSIRPATVNPLDYESKMKFWTALLEDWCIHHSRPVFTLGDVKKAFLRNGRTPACLPSVLENMHKNGDLVAKSSYIHDLSQQTWTAWTMDLLVKRPASWAFTKIKDTINKNTLLTDDTALVHVAACKIVSNKLISNHKEQLVELSELATLWGQQDLEQVLVLVHALRKEGKAAIQEGCPTLIKLGSAHITEVDIGVHALRKNEKTLTRHVEQLETEKQMAVQEARTYLAKNMRQAARSCLRKKHVLEKCIEMRTSALDHINVLLNRIRDAETDAKLVDAYKVGVSALKNSFKTSGLSEDSVADTMLQVQEVLDVHNEIEAALSQPIQTEDSDFEAELAELLKVPESSKPSKLADVAKNKVKSELDEDLLELRLNALSVADLPDPPQSRSKLPEVPVAEPAM